MSSPVVPDTLRHGDWRAVCDTCGLEFYGSTMRMRWDGSFVDDDCWEPYPEGNKTKVVVEDRKVPTARPAKYTNNTFNTDPITSSTSEAGYWAPQII